VLGKSLQAHHGEAARGREIGKPKLGSLAPLLRGCQAHKGAEDVGLIRAFASVTGPADDYVPRISYSGDEAITP